MRKITTYLSRVGSALVGKSVGATAFNQIGGDMGQAAELAKPYQQSVWVQRAIKEVSGPIARVPLYFTVDTRGGDVDYDDPALAAWWRTPAVGLNYSAFIEASIGWLKLAGECFWILDESWLVPFPRLDRLQPMILARPDRMRHVVQGGELRGWEYRDGAGKLHVLLPEQVVQTKLWNPYDPYRGLGEMDAAEIAAEADYAAGAFARNLMQSNGDQGVYIIAKSGVVSDEQRKQILADLREKRRRARNGDFTASFFTGDITVEDPKVQSTDAAFTGGRLQHRHEIYTAFGVPASMADVVASYSIGASSDMMRLLMNTCQPLGEKLADAIEQLASRQIGRVIYAALDWDDHPVMQEVRKERIDAAVKLWDKGMPWQQISDYLKLGLPEFAGWDVGYLPFSVAPVTELSDPATDPAFAEEETAPRQVREQDAAITRMLATLETPRTAPPPAPVEGPASCGCSDAPMTPAERAMVDAFQRSRDAQEVAQWRDLMAKRRTTMKDYERKVRKVLMSARSATLAKLDAAKQDKAIEQGDDGILVRVAPFGGLQTKAAAADFIFDKDDFGKEFSAAMEQAGRNALEAAAQQLLQEINAGDPWTEPPHEVLSFIKVRDNLLKGVSDDVHRKVMDTLSEGIDAGETLDQLAARVRTQFNQLAAGRARAIAQTETAAAYGKGRDIAMDQARIEWKKWLTSGNDNVRASHAAANGQVRRLHEPFDVGGEQLQFPGDSTGSAGNVINCHCVQIAVEGPED